MVDIVSWKAEALCGMLLGSGYNLKNNDPFFSLGIFQCGPCPVNAIRKGDVYLPYDSKFVFAEVNADRIFWLVKDVDGNEKCIKLREETKVIGKSISTKAVGKNGREDITHQYKFPEGELISHRIELHVSFLQKIV